MFNLTNCQLCNKKINNNTIYCAYDIKCCSVNCQKSIINLNKLNKKYYYYNQKCIDKKTIQLIRKCLLEKLAKKRKQKYNCFNIYQDINLYDFLKFYSSLTL